MYGEKLDPIQSITPHTLKNPDILENKLVQISYDLYPKNFSL